MSFNWKYIGKCWKFGDNLGIDGDIMPLRFAIERELDPSVLKEYLMYGVDKEFHKKVTAGEIIVAGKRFGQGNPHIQGFLGIVGHKMGLVVESIPRGSYRNAINAGLPFLPECPGITSLVDNGDQLEVDFKTGVLINNSKNITHNFKPVEKQLRSIIETGGWKANFALRLSKS
jgi:3-isopropylmalate/(R)-2-methylmalate dehydratase small subunit